MKNLMSKDEIGTADSPATPIDFDQLVSEGILVKRGFWYETAALERLPSDLRKRIKGFKASSDNTTLVKFSRSDKKALRRLKKPMKTEPIQE